MELKDIIEAVGKFMAEVADSNIITIVGFVLTFIGAMTTSKWFLKWIIPYLYDIFTDYNIRVSTTYDGGKDKSDPMEFPWEMIDPHKDGSYPISVQNGSDHRLKFEAEFEIDESWPINRNVRIEDVFKHAVPGNPNTLIAREFIRNTGGSQSFTFPFVPHSSSCLVTVTVKPILDVEQLGVPHIVSEFLGDVYLKEEKRYYRITAEDETIERFTPYP